MRRPLLAWVLLTVVWLLVAVVIGFTGGADF